MWPDPFDPKRRKLSFMKGTPTNAYSFFVPAAGVVLTIGLINLIPYIPYFEKKIEKVGEACKESDSQRELKALRMDPHVDSALSVKRSEHETDKLKAWLDIN